jgi:hypothetical protein
MPEIKVKLYKNIIKCDCNEFQAVLPVNEIGKIVGHCVNCNSDNVIIKSEAING